MGEGGPHLAPLIAHFIATFNSVLFSFPELFSPLKVREAVFSLFFLSSISTAEAVNVFHVSTHFCPLSLKLSEMLEHFRTACCSGVNYLDELRASTVLKTGEGKKIKPSFH